MGDVFNNSSNDYIYPGLSPCPGVADDTYLEFIDDQIGIISGSEILSKIDFSDFKIPVSSYSTQIKVLSQGEVVYVPGLTKGLCKRQQGFTMPSLVSTDEDKDSYFIEIDLSINYYKDFSYINSNMDASANYALNVDIDDALNIVFGNANVNTTAVYDPSTFFFIGTVDGYDFEVTNVVISIIDTSENENSSFDHSVNASIYELEENLLLDIPYAKYPNGAMQGMILRGTYPSTSCDSDQWVYMNNVVSPYIVYETIGIYDGSTHETLTFDPSVVFPSLSFDISCNVADISVNYDIIPFEPSLYNQEVPNDQTYSGYYFEDCNYIDQLAIAMTLHDSSTLRCDFLGTGGTGDGTITSSYIKDGSVRYVSDISTCTFSNSYIIGLEGETGTWTRITDSIIQGGDNDTLQLTILTNSTIEYCDASNNYAYDTTFLDSSIAGGFISRGWIQNSDLYDVSVNDASLLCSNVYDGSLNRVFGYDVYVNDASIENSEFKNSTFNKGTTLTDSSIQNSWTDGIYLNTSYAIDTSINNTIATDCSIYTSQVYDSSLINCTLYNVSLDQDDSSIYLDGCRTIMINATYDSSIIWKVNDTSVYYEQFSKKIDVGRNTPGTSKILSASEYLDYINSNNLWDKVGEFVSRISSIDPADSTKNLVGGFYVFNPQVFDVKIEYLLFV